MPRPRLVIGLAGLAITIAAGAHLFLQPGAAAPARAEAAPRPAVITLAAAVPAGHLLRAGDLRARTLSGPLPAGAVLAGTPEAARLAGAVTKRAFAAGEPLVTDGLHAPGERGFLAALITPGHRAIAVAVEAATAAGGLIQPGDHVDLVLTQELREEGLAPSQRVVSETVLSDARVLSTDQRLDPPGGAPAAEAVAPGRAIPTTLTLEVTPAEAERVAVATTLGRLHVTLRAMVREAADPGPPRATWAGSVSPALAALRPPPRPQLSAPPAAAPPAPRPAAPAASAVRIFRGSGDPA